jgi:hypothetical protein
LPPRGSAYMHDIAVGTLIVATVIEFCMKRLIDRG